MGNLERAKNITTMEKLVQGTVQNSTSGTSIDFIGIPSWAKKITVMFNGVSLSGTSSILIQIGSGSIETTGYTSTSAVVSTTSSNITAGYSSTNGFAVIISIATYTVSGIMNLSLLSTNLWVSSHSIGGSQDARFGGGSKTLSGTLDRIRITTVNGTDTFDAGQINILVEG